MLQLLVHLPHTPIPILSSKTSKKLLCIGPYTTPPNHLFVLKTKPFLVTRKYHDNVLHITRCSENMAFPATFSKGNIQTVEEVSTSTSTSQGKNFWGAVSLIIGTAVGPGMLCLPAATIQSGPIPSTIAILFSWVYVVSSIILVAELSFVAMEEDGFEEVSFTGLANKALGNAHFGAFVAIVYASLSFSLLVACVSGIGSLVSQRFPQMNPAVANALFPLCVGLVIGFFPFKAIDGANRFLCFVMLLSVTVLVGIGLCLARGRMLASFGYASWTISSILPSIPVTVLTLGFHVITPFVCRIAGNSVREARKAILFGGAVPLVMVLSWNLIILGLVGDKRGSFGGDPMSLLLSVSPNALFAVRGFAFSALATSLIGYAVSFPKQLLDTLDLIFGSNNMNILKQYDVGAGKVGCVFYYGRPNVFVGNTGRVSFIDSSRSNIDHVSKARTNSRIVIGFDSREALVLLLVLGSSVLLASLFRSTFARALNFAGIYANCFLFGILPPAMAYMYQSRNKARPAFLPGGDSTLLVLFAISMILGIWH